MRTVEQEFERWCRGTQHPGLNPIQLKEIRRAFYSGAFLILGQLWDMGDDSVSEDEGAAKLEKLFQECKKFFSDIKNGRA